MPIRKDATPKSPINVGWVPDDSGYQKTRSPLIITNSMVRLRENRRFVSLTKKGYVSGNTILVDFSSKHLEIDKPLDWPPRQGGPILVRFQDEANLLNYYRTKVVKVTENSIITEFPTELYQLQRRQYFRVSVPGSNSVSLQCKGDSRSGLIAQDISIRGLLVARKKNQIFAVGEEVHNLRLDIYSVLKGDKPEILFQLQAKQGEVVRLAEHQQIQQHIAGLRLFPDKKEEKALLEYIRKRELSDLRKP